MKTVVKINPSNEYESAKNALQVLLSEEEKYRNEYVSIGDSLDNLHTVINVLMERLSPKKLPKPKKDSQRPKKESKPREEFDKLPSQKFPDLKVEEVEQRSAQVPACPCCHEAMKESGLFKVSEKLELIPKQYFITRNKRIIYNCSHCNGSMRNSPPVPSISPSSNYGDSLIIDASLSKYCDLIPMERYCAMAAREGLPGIPPNSMIGLTHVFADFLRDVYVRIKEEILSSRVAYADETPHKMLEGDESPNWYFWQFSTNSSCYFEAHNSRSGDVPFKFLKDSQIEVLLTDAYSGYKGCLRKLRENGARHILEAYCNAHAIRYFKEASVNWEAECQDILDQYKNVYDIEAECRSAKTDQDKIDLRQQMKPCFLSLKKSCEEKLPQLVAKSSFEKAINYFLAHFEGLSLCCDDYEVPIDNNSSERNLRSPVIGRKTWYGTHSRRGARSHAILFSIVETCKLNKINPRNYFHWVTKQIHSKLPPLTPKEYAIYDSG